MFEFILSLVALAAIDIVVNRLTWPVLETFVVQATKGYRDTRVSRHEVAKVLGWAQAYSAMSSLTILVMWFVIYSQVDRFWSACFITALIIGTYYIPMLLPMVARSTKHMPLPNWYHQGLRYGVLAMPVVGAAGLFFQLDWNTPVQVSLVNTLGVAWMLSIAVIMTATLVEHVARLLYSEVAIGFTRVLTLASIGFSLGSSAGIGYTVGGFWAAFGGATIAAGILWATRIVSRKHLERE